MSDSARRQRLKSNGEQPDRQGCQRPFGGRAVGTLSWKVGEGHHGRYRAVRDTMVDIGPWGTYGRYRSMRDTMVDIGP